MEIRLTESLIKNNVLDKNTIVISASTKHLLGYQQPLPVSCCDDVYTRTTDNVPSRVLSFVVVD